MIPATVELLRFCAFLYPDDIPEEIITEGAPDLGPILQPIAANSLRLNKAIAELRKYSLVRRDLEAKTFSIHRLVQAVLKDGMDEEMQCMWAERTVRAVNRALPDVEYAAWHRYQRCLPHVLVCAIFIEQWEIKSIEAARLLDQAGNYLKGVAQNVQAEAFLQQSLAIREQLWGSNHPYVATSLNNLAELYRQGQYTQAEPLYRRALAIWEQTFGPEHRDHLIT